MRKYGGAGNRNPDRKAYDGHIYPHRTRPLPDDFRERYLEMGWEAQWYYSCNWRVMCRWIDEAGGEELITARAQWVSDFGRRRHNHVMHKGGWDAEKLQRHHEKREA
ncbi:MAG: hypothetical protein ABJ233_00195 [Erythrobacter sp.]